MMPVINQYSNENRSYIVQIKIVILFDRDVGIKAM
jgi:hypothetical protein